MASIGLYYPFIHFKDDNWLKLSALYWYKMGRIVPPTYAPAEGGVVLEGDSDVTRSLADELDFVINVEPEEATYPVSELFGQLLVKHSKQLRERYDVGQREHWEVDEVTARYAQQRDPRLAYVNSTKLHPDLISGLADVGLAESYFDGSGHWAGMHPHLAGVYMAALAEEAATMYKLHPVSDETADHVAAAGWSLPRLTAALLDQPTLAEEAELAEDDASDASWSHEELHSTLALVAIENVIAISPEEVTVDQVVAIREEFGEELFRFQALVDQVATQLPDLPGKDNPAVVKAHVEGAYEEQIEPLLPDLKAAMRGHGIDTVEAAMGTSIAMPPAFPPIPIDDPVTFGVAGALSFIPVLRAKRRQAQQAYRDSPAAYLYRLEQHLRPKTLLQRIGQRAQHFLIGI